MAMRQGIHHDYELPPNLRSLPGPTAGIQANTYDWQPRPKIPTVLLKTPALLKLFNWTDRMAGSKIQDYNAMMKVINFLTFFYNLYHRK